MTLNTKASLITLVTTIGLYIVGPLLLTVLLVYTAVYALIATIFGESLLEDSVSGDTTFVGYILLGIFFCIAVFPIVLSVYSIVVERITKGKKTPIISFAKGLRRHSFKITACTLTTSLIFIASGALSFIYGSPPYYDDVNIGAAIMLFCGITLLVVSIPFVVLHKVNQRNQRASKRK